MIERDALLPDLEPEVPPGVADGALDGHEYERHQHDDQPAAGKCATRDRTTSHEERAKRDHGGAHPHRDVELRAPQARDVDDVEREGAQGPEHAADRVVGRLSGGLPEPSVGRTRLGEVDGVPGCPEQHAGAAGDQARAAPSCGHQSEHGGDEEWQRERGAELRGQGEPERDAPHGELCPRATGQEHRRDEEERRDDEVVEDRCAVQQDDREGREHEPAVSGGLAREAEPARDQDDREQARPQRDELRERCEPLRARKDQRRVEADLGDRRVPVETRIVSRGHVAHTTLIVPEERPCLVVRQPVPVVRCREERDGGEVDAGGGHCDRQRSDHRVGERVAPGRPRWRRPSETPSPGDRERCRRDRRDRDDE